VLNMPHLSLVNILAGARVVPEFMPFVRSTSEIAQVAERLLVDEQWRSLMSQQLGEVVRPLAAPRASERVCHMITEMLGITGPANHPPMPATDPLPVRSSSG
jgi:lipid A disaccharide synthetase